MIPKVELKSFHEQFYSSTSFYTLLCREGSFHKLRSKTGHRCAQIGKNKKRDILKLSHIRSKIFENAKSVL